VVTLSVSSEFRPGEIKWNSLQTLKLNDLIRLFAIVIDQASETRSSERGEVGESLTLRDSPDLPPETVYITLSYC
jgi:hypothetical protein